MFFHSNRRKDVASQPASPNYGYGKTFVIVIYWLRWKYFRQVSTREKLTPNFLHQDPGWPGWTHPNLELKIASAKLLLSSEFSKFFYEIVWCIHLLSRRKRAKYSFCDLQYSEEVIRLVCTPPMGAFLCSGQMYNTELHDTWLQDLTQHISKSGMKILLFLNIAICGKCC